MVKRDAIGIVFQRYRSASGSPVRLAFIKGVLERVTVPVREELFQIEARQTVGTVGQVKVALNKPGGQGRGRGKYFQGNRNNQKTGCIRIGSDSPVYCAFHRSIACPGQGSLVGIRIIFRRMKANQVGCGILESVRNLVPNSDQIEIPRTVAIGIAGRRTDVRGKRRVDFYALLQNFEAAVSVGGLYVDSCRFGNRIRCWIADGSYAIECIGARFVIGKTDTGVGSDLILVCGQVQG